MFSTIFIDSQSFFKIFFKKINFLNKQVIEANRSKFSCRLQITFSVGQLFFSFNTVKIFWCKFCSHRLQCLSKNVYEDPNEVLQYFLRYYIVVREIFEPRFYCSRYIYCVKSLPIRSFFWSVFSCIRTEYRDLLRKYRKIRTRKNCVFGHFHAAIIMRASRDHLQISFLI